MSHDDAVAALSDHMRQTEERNRRFAALCDEARKKVLAAPVFVLRNNILQAIREADDGTVIAHQAELLKALDAAVETTVWSDPQVREGYALPGDSSGALVGGIVGGLTLRDAAQRVP